MEHKPECKPPSGAEAQKAFAGHGRTEVECMHAAERAHRGQDVFSHLVVCNFVLGLPRAAHRICGETSVGAAGARPLAVSPLLARCGNLKQGQKQKQDP